MITVELMRTIDRSVAECLDDVPLLHPAVPVNAATSLVMARAKVPAERWVHVLNLVCRRCLSKGYVLRFGDA